MPKRRRAKKHREPPKSAEPHLPPVDKSVGESRDNLARRAEWFERRSGTRDPREPSP